MMAIVYQAMVLTDDFQAAQKGTKSTCQEKPLWILNDHLQSYLCWLLEAGKPFSTFPFTDPLLIFFGGVVLGAKDLTQSGPRTF